MAFKITLFDTEYECIGTGCMSLEYITWQLQAANGDDLEIEISSCGGSAFDAVAIYHLLKSYSGKVTTINIAVAGSAAATIFAAGSTRIMSKYALLMIHPASVITAGDAKQILSDASMLTKTTEAVKAIWTDNSNADAEVISQMVDSTTWLSADEALALGMCTAIMDYTEAVRNANLVLNRANKAPNKYKQIVNHILNTPITAQIETPMTQAEKDEFNGKFDNLFKRIGNWFKATANKAVLNNTPLYFVGNLQEGAAVFNDAEMTVPANDIEDDEIENAGKKAKMSIVGGVVTAFAEVAPANDDNADEEDEEMEAENRVVLNKVGIQHGKKVANKVVKNAMAARISQYAQNEATQSALIADLRAQLTVANTAIQLTETEVRNSIIAEYVPRTSQRSTSATTNSALPEWAKVKEGTLAANAVKKVVK